MPAGQDHDSLKLGTVPFRGKSDAGDSPHFQVERLSRPERLDVYLSRALALTRARIKNLITGRSVLLNGRVLQKAGILLRGGERIEVSIPKPPPHQLQPESIPLDILFEDESLLILNKAPGIVVHPAAGNWNGTLVNALLYHFKKLSSVDPARPGIVHRLDKDTSGILLVAKNDQAHLELSRQLKEREIEKVYQVLVHGSVKSERGTIDRPIGRHPKNRKKMAIIPSGRNAVTHYKVLRRFKEHTLLECRIETGRTHQIRVHLASIGHPVAGDEVYGKKETNLGISRQLLHAWKIKFRHPVTGLLVSFEAPLPNDFLVNLKKASTV